jgi:DNA-binding transcriptional LysR family regulator
MRELGDSRAVLVASGSLLGKSGRPAHPQDLSGFPTIGMTGAGDKFTWGFREPDCTPINVTLSPRLMTDSFDALRAAAVAGVGIAYLPEFVVQEDIESGALERVLPEFGLLPGLVHVVFPTRRGMVPAVRAFIDALAEGFHESCPKPAISA